MNPLTYNLPGFRGLSRIENKQPTQASSIQNVIVRDTSIRTRLGSAVQIAALTNPTQFLNTYKKKSGTKVLVGADGTNLRVSTNFTSWGNPLKSDCNNSNFCGTVFSDDKIYMGNGTDKLVYDGTTLASMGGTPPAFTMIEDYKNRLFSNNTAEPTYLYYTDVSNGATLGDNYLQIAEDTGDIIKGLAKLLTHLVIINEFSSYALYGSGASSFTKSLIGPVGTVDGKTIANINGAVYWVSHNGIYEYSGGQPVLISMKLGDTSTMFNTARYSYATAIGFDNRYWLAIAEAGQTSNNIVLVYDTLDGEWEIYKYPFSINTFVVDGNSLYAATSDKNIYKLNTGTADGTTAITSSWCVDSLDLNAPGRIKKVKTIAIGLADVAAGGTINLYLKEDDGAYGTAFPITIPTSAPGETIVVKVKTDKFYNLSLKLESTASVVINSITFGGKVKPKVK